MEGLFANGADRRALELITAPTDRSWRHMVESGTTITWEAWDQKYKPNQDWNHAWGASPAYLLPRYVLGVEPLSAGWKETRICPQTGPLSFAKGKIPTPLGPITLSWENKSSFQMSLSLPEGMTAKLDLPATEASKGVSINGKPVASSRVGSRWILNEPISGEVRIQIDPS
jgi:alpha-L-rhamnosidase